MPTAEKILSLARKELDYKEYPANSNRTKYGKWYGLDGEPWCMMFIMWIFDQAGAADLLPVRTPSCGVFRNAAKKAGNWHTEDYQPGDVVIFDFPGNRVKTDHVGIVERAGKESVVTIEGNTGVGNDANGGEVMRRNRNISLILGAFRPAYSETEETEEAGETGETDKAEEPVKAKKRAEAEKGLYAAGDEVHFTGEHLYAGYDEDAASFPAAPSGAKIDAVQPDGAHPYYLYGGALEGWADAADVYAASAENTESDGSANSGKGTDRTNSPDSPGSTGSTGNIEDAGSTDTGDGKGKGRGNREPDSLSVLPRTVIVTARSSLKVRSGPGVNYSKLSNLSYGKKVVIVEEKPGWGRLADGGWICLQYTSDVGV